MNYIKYFLQFLNNIANFDTEQLFQISQYDSIFLFLLISDHLY